MHGTIVGVMVRVTVIVWVDLMVEVGVGVGVSRGVSVNVGASVGVGVDRAVHVDVTVGLGPGDFVEVIVAVSVGVGVTVRVADAVAVAVTVGVLEGVGDGVSVPVGSAVAVKTGVLVSVGGTGVGATRKLHVVSTDCGGSFRFLAITFTLESPMGRFCGAAEARNPLTSRAPPSLQGGALASSQGERSIGNTEGVPLASVSSSCTERGSMSLSASATTKPICTGDSVAPPGEGTWLDGTTNGTE